MKYIRPNGAFTIAKILDQIVQYVNLHKKIPETIFLPSQEYIYINCLASKPYDMIAHQITEFLGIPLEPYNEPQEEPFFI